MADRYWVGGSGTWNSTTKWSTTSGGSTGASVPTAADNAIFDANSATGNAYVVTIAAGQTCADLTYTPVAIDGATEFSIIGNFDITGTFSTSGTQGNRRLWLRSSVQSMMRDVSIAAIGTVTDVDFRDIRITGTGGTLTGTRIGDLKSNVGITFSAPKTVYRIGVGSWSDDQWSDTSGGTPNTDFFPLAQDTAVIDESTSVGTLTFNSLVQYTGTVDMSARTTAITCSNATNFYIYGNWTLGSGVTCTGSTFWFVGGGLQVITSAGVQFNNPIYIDSYAGTVELADALNIGGQNLILANGTFDTKDYSLNAGTITSSNSTVREIKLGASTVTLSAGGGISFSASTNLTFDAGTSQINLINSFPVINGGFLGQTFYDVIATAAGGTNKLSVQGPNTFRNLSITAPSSAGSTGLFLSADQVITGTLTVSGASEVRRVIVLSSNTSNNAIVGTPRTVTVGTLLADYCDFRDITIAGTAAGGSPTNAGDCGGNTGVTFPAAKTVYWNLAGTQNWSATAWAMTSGGTPAADNFPLAQDTAVFDDTGSVGTVTVQAFNISGMDMSARTSAMTLQGNTAYTVYGNWTFGSGVTHAGTATITFSGRGTSTITSNGKVFAGGITTDCGTGSTVQLADALEMQTTRTLMLTSGTFDAVTYNVTAKTFDAGGVIAKTVKLGTGTWTLSGTSSVWSISASTTVLYQGTADILLSNTSTTARSFVGGQKSYNKLTIGGATGTSTFSFNDSSNSFTEIASTKTVAHTIDMKTFSQTLGKWSVTGTVGNVVTLTGTGSQRINGSRVSGVDYLAMGTIALVTTGLLASPAEFYAGANSTGSGAGVIFEDAPTPVTRYWVGGTGTWNATTTNWSATSGGAGGASVPTSADAVIFDSASNATAYTVTISTVPARCGTLTVNGPASGNLTLSSSQSVPTFVHDDITFAATGLASLFNMSGGIVLSGSTTGRTFTTNGVTVTANTGNPTVDGVGCSWTLGGAANFGNNAGLTVKNGSFSTSNYSVILPNMVVTGTGTTSISLGSSTVTMGGSSNAVNFGTTEAAKSNFTFNSGTSLINLGVNNLRFNGNGHTFYDVDINGAAVTNISAFTGTNTFNNLSFIGRSIVNSGVGISNRTISDDQTINGTLTLSAGTDAATRTFFRSVNIGTTITLTCNAVASLTDIDFRDITIAGAAVSGGNLTGTRLGDCKGNTGITFDAPKTVYWVFSGSTTWGPTPAVPSWGLTPAGTATADAFPLAQDTAVVDDTGPGSGGAITTNSAYNIGTLDMSARTNPMNFNSNSNAGVYGNWISSSAVTVTGTGELSFAGRGSQTLTSAGATFPGSFVIESPGGSVTLQDALESSRGISAALNIRSGTFDANGYNVTLSAGGVSSQTSNTRAIAAGSGTWTIASAPSPWTSTINLQNFSVTGTGTFRFTNASAKTVAFGGVDYSGITLDQGGEGILTVSGNNTFADITNSYSATGATTIKFSSTTQRVSNFTATGTAGNVLTIQGNSAVSPCNLVHTGTGDISIDYVALIGVRAYQI